MKSDYIICIRVNAENLQKAKNLILDNDHIICGISFIFKDVKI